MRSPWYLLDPCHYLKEISGKKQNVFQKSRLDWNRSLKKALSFPCKGILFPEDLLQNPNLPLFIKETKKNNLKPIIQIHAGNLQERHLNKAIKNFFISYKAGLNVIFHDPKIISVKDLKEFPASFYLFTFLALKKNSSLDLSKNLDPWILKNMELYFPYKRHLNDPFLTPKDVYKYIKKQKPFSLAYPYRGDIYDNRIEEESSLEPVTKPFIEYTYQPLQEKSDFSIIIPSYNNKSQLITTLKQLKNLNYKKNLFEVIVVDDGSSDNTSKALRQFTKSELNYNLQAIYFPRVKPRKPGDANFRAGIARNLGVKYAKGKYLAFLDGDILAPPDYLTQLKTEHEGGADLVQLKRYHLKKFIPLEQLSFDWNQMKSIAFIEDKSYWKPFYEKGFEGMACPWKYTCTYGLSLLKKEFLDQGRFGRTFLYYGFEDTDLGYRLFKSGKKLLLSRIKCYHQFVSGNRQEDSKNSFKRHSLLAKTAKIFFYRHLDPFIFEEFISYMKPDWNLSYFTSFTNKKP